MYNAFDDLLECITIVLKRRIPNLVLGGFSDPPRLTDMEAKEAYAMWMERGKSAREAAAGIENGKVGEG